MASVLPVDFIPLPTEITEQALIHCHPCDVASFSQTCRAAYLLVYNSPDQHLWRQLFLLFPFDDPRETLQGFREDIDFDWKTELQQRVRAELIARSAGSTPEERHEVLTVLLGVVRSASPVKRGFERVSSPSLLWVMDVLESTNLLRLSPFSPLHACQTLARLRSYLALSLDEYDDDDEEAKLRMKSMRTQSRCLVYDLSHYHGNNDLGPFMPKTGEVDWFHVECIMNVVAFNLAEYSRRFMYTRPPCGLEATRAYSAPHATNLSPRDWAGVEGNWRRIVCFMDYRDLFAFNLSTHGNPTQGESFFDDPHFSEATRLIELKLHIISPDAIPNFYTLDRFPDSKNPRYPTLYFSGTSFWAHGNTTVVGSVHMTDDGLVRWRYASAYGEHMQWSSEGVQIGGIASATGVVGNWTGGHNERGDPVGKEDVAMGYEFPLLTASRQDLSGFGKYQIIIRAPFEHWYPSNNVVDSILRYQVDDYVIVSVVI